MPIGLNITAEVLNVGSEQRTKIVCRGFLRERTIRLAVDFSLMNNTRTSSMMMAVLCCST